MSQLQKLTQQINEEINQMIQVASSQSEENIQRKLSEEAWSIKEILCHAEEASRYWVNEVLAVVQKNSEVWGRTLADEKRLAGVARSKEMTTEKILQDLEKVKPFIAKSLSTLKEEELYVEAPSRNPKFGTRSMAFVLEHFMVEHLHNHVKQMERNIS